MKIIKKILKIYLIVMGITAHLFLIWMITNLPIFLDIPLIRTEPPIKAEAIVCLGSGVTSSKLPSREGWDRIYSAVQLYFDDYAPKIIFTGSRASGLSEAEIYSEAAQWLGLPEEAAILDVNASRTADHPRSIQELPDIKIKKDSPINIVTSPLHTKRAGLCFKKKGYTNFRMIGYYSSEKLDPSIARHLRRSRFETFKSSYKLYNDPLFRLKKRTYYFFDAVRETAAIFWYKLKGFI